MNVELDLTEVGRLLFALDCIRNSGDKKIDRQTDSLIKKLDKVIEGDAKKYEGDGLKIGGKGMKGFYGSPKENSLGILGDLAKSLYKQTPEKIILDNIYNLKKKLTIIIISHKLNNLRKCDKIYLIKNKKFYLYKSTNNKIR